MRKYISLFILLLFSVSISAQNLKQATQLFDKGEYEKAKPAFQRLVKSAPSNAGYNYYYGACLYETGDKEAAFPYIEKSAKRKYINAYRYLGKLYADMYHYDEAIENYETHIEWLIEKNRDTEMAEAELAFIRKCARMLKGVEKVTVIDSFVVNKSNFLETYKISKESGKIATLPEIAGTLYENEMGNKLIYADSIDDGTIQLYTQIKLLDGWGKAEPITSLNELGNVNYPYLMGDGTTLYFASDNEESLGGYDIFITRYDSEDNEYLRPSNVGMPFNSTANDYMMAIDEFNNLGWFASDRNQPQDSVCIYVFIPNASKQTYNYENTDLQTIIDAATLREIRKTWDDEEIIQASRNLLAKVLEGDNEKQKKQSSFTFIVNDLVTYDSLEDFRSPEAKRLYQQLMSREKEIAQLENKLLQHRDQYAQGNAQIKKNLTPTILDLENKIPLMKEEMERQITQVRNLEIQKITK